MTEILSKPCPVCEQTKRDTTFSQLCGTCGWEMETFFQNEERMLDGISEQLAVRKRYWKESQLLEKDTDSFNDDIEDLGDRVAAYAKELAELEAETQDLDDVLSIFKSQNENKKSFLELKSELRKRQALIDLSPREIEDELSDYEQSNMVEVHCSVDQKEVVIRIEDFPKNNLRVLLGLSKEETVQTVHDAGLLINLSFVRDDFKLHPDAGLVAKWPLDLNIKGKYFIRFLKYQEEQEEQLKILTATDTINF